MTNCSQCGTGNHASARFCSKCGAPLAAEKPTGPAPTQQLIQTLSFTPLGKGELLHDDRYEVRACLSQGADRNTYLVQDGACAECGKYERNAGNFCEACGADLAQHRLYLLIEGSTEQEVAGERLLASRRALHPRLVNYYAAFTAALARMPSRSYVVADPLVAGGVQTPGVHLGQRLSELPALIAEDALQQWKETAAGVDALLQVGLWLPTLERSQLLLVDRAVRLDAAATVQEYDQAQRTTILARQAQVLGRLLRQLAPGPLSPAAALLLDDPQQSPACRQGMSAWATAVRSASLEAPGQQPGQELAGAGSLQPPAGNRAAGAALTQPLAPPTVAVPLAVEAAALSDLGNVREINEDSLAKLDLDMVHNSASQPLRLYAVADGMGGHAAGEVASMLATHELVKSLLDQHRTTIAAAGAVDLRVLLKGAGQSAAKAVYDQAQRMHTDMGTTLVAALVDANAAKAHIINVGDSRLYKVRGQTIRQVTKDHSMVQLLIDKQQLTAEEARRHPNANLIYRTLGDKAAVEIDAFEESLASGDALLLCSDGLSGLVEDAELAAAIREEKTPGAACRRLVTQAKQRGGHDNITVIIVQFHAQGAAGGFSGGGL